ncbi:MAG: hypothetical protein GY719_31415 [bacterium]|nr:hypothetical protein [bacterium]
MTLLTLTPSGVAAEEAQILNLLRAYFGGGVSAQARSALVERITGDEAWDRSRLSEQLHRARIHKRLKPGRLVVEMDVGYGQRRGIMLRIPEGYTPERAWPLVYALHPSGSNAPSFMRRAEQLLGKAVNDYVIAAPTDYHQTVIDAPPPYTPEHPVMLREFRRRVHLDSDRFYPLGYSLGGYAAWTLAILHPDEFAGSVSISAAFSSPTDVDGLWRALVPNFQHLPVLHAWGERDGLTVPGFEGRNQSTGSMSSLNRKLSPLIKEWNLGVIEHRQPGAGHGGVNPPRAQLMKILEGRRQHYPKQVRHTFRHIHQARAYWLEGHEWVGSHWKQGQRIRPRRGESKSAAYGRVILEQLGELRGEIDGQTLRVERRHVGELTVWLGDGMIDWQKPITVVVEGKTVFEGHVQPDPGVALAQAARTRDFDRLRWAGIKVLGPGKVEVVSAETGFPPYIRVP